MDKEELTRDAYFLRAMAIILLVMTLAAFAPRYLLPVLQGTYEPPASWNAWMHPHAIGGFGFSVLLAIQPSLIARRRFDLHRKLGWVGAALVVLSVVSGVGVQLGVFPTTPEDVSNIAGGAFRLFQSLPFMVGFFIAAYVLRKRADWHWRFMYMAAFAAVGTVLGRLYLHYTAIPLDLIGPMVGIGNLAFVLVLPVSDKLRRRRVHPASWIALGVFLVSQAVLVPLQMSDFWINAVTQ